MRFNRLKKDLENVAFTEIDEHWPFLVETDASEVAISTTLNQGVRPVAFFSRSLHESQLGYPVVEKEAMIIRLLITSHNT